MKSNKSETKTINTNERIQRKKLRLKDVYLKNKFRRYNEIVDVKNRDISLISNPKTVISRNKYPIIIASVVIIALLLSTMYKEIPTFLITLAFLLGISIIIIIFNAFKLVCQKDGMTICFGFQKVFFEYERIKCIYLSKYDTYSSLRLIKDYNIVISYADNNGFIKELSFSTLFLLPEQIDAFLSNFITENKNSEEVINFEKFKLIKKIIKVILYIAVVALFIGLLFVK